MERDLLLLGQWWLAWFFLGGIGFLAGRRLFMNWDDQGYLVTKILGVGGVSLVSLLLGSLRLIPFTVPGIMLSAAVVLGISLLVNISGKQEVRQEKRKLLKTIVAEELLFFGLLLGWAWVKGHEPSINGLEKFMDYGFTKSIMRTMHFPPMDMWYAGEPINYYYFGHLVLATTTKLSGVGLEYTFNMMLATLFALAFTMTYSISRQLFNRLHPVKKTAAALMVGWLLALGGNLQTIYAFTRGYSTDTPPPFWTVWSDLTNWDSIKAGWQAYWYPNATRFIPFTIHEFPSYSFVVSDIHGHVLSIPLALFLFALLMQMFIVGKQKGSLAEYAVYGAVAGMAFMTNALDGPIYLGLLGLLTLWTGVVGQFRNTAAWVEAAKRLGMAAVTFVMVVLPFMLHFKPFVSGIGVNCPPPQLWEKQVGPFLFENGEKCQKSPFWMLMLLWGWFVFGGAGLFFVPHSEQEKRLREVFAIVALFCTALIIFPEFFYFKDIYPAHFRSNTMFKLGYQVFMMMSIITGYVFIQAIRSIKKFRVYVLAGIPLLILVLIYPYFGVKSYFGNLETYQGLNGLEWMRKQMPDDWQLVNWMDKEIPSMKQPVILEAAGDSYTQYERISAFTGLPTPAGWTVHEWLWRGYEIIAARGEEVREIYEGEEAAKSAELLRRLKIEYIVVGGLEREKYPNLNLPKLRELGRPVYQEGDILLFQVI